MTDAPPPTSPWLWPKAAEPPGAGRCYWASVQWRGLGSHPHLRRWGIVAISGGATRTGLTLDQPDGRFFFRTAYRNDLEGLLIGNYLVGSLDIQTHYMVDDSEPHGGIGGATPFSRL